jgi:hypothetical protein
MMRGAYLFQFPYGFRITALVIVRVVLEQCKHELGHAQRDACIRIVEQGQDSVSPFWLQYRGMFAVQAQQG